MKTEEEIKQKIAEVQISIDEAKKLRANAADQCEINDYSYLAYDTGIAVLESYKTGLEWTIGDKK